MSKYAEEPQGLIVVNQRTGDIGELIKSWIGFVIFAKEYNQAPQGLAVYPYVIYDDDKRFYEYEIVGKI